MPNSKVDLEVIRGRCRLMLDILLKESGITNHLSGELNRVVDLSFERKSRRNLESLERDIAESTLALRDAARRELDLALRNQFGAGLRNYSNEEGAVVRRVIAQGQIRTEEEYQVLLTRAEAIHADPSLADELNDINNLLARRHLQK
jgi:hypothetical protein